MNLLDYLKTTSKFAGIKNINTGYQPVYKTVYKNNISNDLSKLQEHHLNNLDKELGDNRFINVHGFKIDSMSDHEKSGIVQSRKEYIIVYKIEESLEWIVGCLLKEKDIVIPKDISSGILTMTECNQTLWDIDKRLNKLLEAYLYVSKTREVLVDTLGVRYIIPNGIPVEDRYSYLLYKSFFTIASCMLNYLIEEVNLPPGAVISSKDFTSITIKSDSIEGIEEIEIKDCLQNSSEISIKPIIVNRSCEKYVNFIDQSTYNRRD